MVYIHVSLHIVSNIHKSLFSHKSTQSETMSKLKTRGYIYLTRARLFFSKDLPKWIQRRAEKLPPCIYLLIVVIFVYLNEIKQCNTDRTNTMAVVMLDLNTLIY